MTKNEQARYAANFLKRRTSRIVGLQSGYNEQLANFADPYVHDTLADTAEGSTDAPTDTTQGSDNDSNWTGKTNGAVDNSDDITAAISIIQKHLASLGDDSLLAKWASTADQLKRIVSSGATQASPNPEGSTRSPLVVNDNENSSHPGSHGFIDVADLENAARKVTTLSSKIVLNPGDKL